MFDWMRQMMRRWTAWIGDRDLEIALRQKLSAQGFFGGSAEFKNLRLVAVQRPGWVQVFSFSATAKPMQPEQAEPVTVYGLVRQDERYSRVEIEFFQRPAERNRLFESWSLDLVRLRRPAL